jgi:hypothetical protein
MTTEKIKEQIVKYRKLHEIAVDDYCSDWRSTRRTRKGLNNMIKYSKRIEKLEIRLSSKTKPLMEKKIFYRVKGIDCHTGLWYDRDGTFTNRIGQMEPRCKNSDLPMPYDENTLGYLSAVDSIESMYYWFSKEDLKNLEEKGFVLKIFESTDYKYYDNHWLISIKNSKIIG